MTEQRTEAAQLRQAWINEKCAPDLLFYQDRLVESAKRKMRKHEAASEQLLANEEERFQAKLLQMDVARMRFVLSSYLRVRLLKICKFTTHLLLEHRARLSKAEGDFALSYIRSMENHFHQAFLDRVPTMLHKLDEGPSEVVSVNMVTEPDRNTFVYLRVNDPSAYQDAGVSKGDILLARYASVFDKMERGEVELL